MKLPEKKQRWVLHEDTLRSPQARAVTRRVLAYTDGLMCVENPFEKGAVGALHHHPHTQITYVVSSAVEFTVDGVTRTVHKGDTILKEDGVERGCVCTEASIPLDIFTPMREDFVK
ncbi:MAG: cupin domain-containing protein [Subdoligranulum sp.]|nr:cupin domain-containing protein [Subdoligranulum sp.]